VSKCQSVKKENGFVAVVAVAVAVEKTQRRIDLPREQVWIRDNEVEN